MTLPTIYPTQYSGTGANTLTNDFNKVKCDRSGAARINAGRVSVPSGTAFTTIVGLTPFNKGARFNIDSTSIYCGNFGAATTTVDIGYVYDDNTTYTNDVDAWASASTAPQSGGFVTVDEFAGLTFVAAADGWIVATINTANADATANIDWNFIEAYDGLGINNSNNQN
jgi:hypothetical protein